MNWTRGPWLLAGASLGHSFPQTALTGARGFGLKFNLIFSCLLFPLLLPK